jgi:quinol monooxygenase YgiN
MVKLGLFVRLEAKAGKEAEVAAFLNAGLGLAQEEQLTPVWFALKLSPSTFAVFDAFEQEAGREAHLNGAIAKALMAKAPELLASAPTIEKLEVLGAKLPH